MNTHCVAAPFRNWVNTLSGKRRRRFAKAMRHDTGRATANRTIIILLGMILPISGYAQTEPAADEPAEKKSVEGFMHAGLGSQFVSNTYLDDSKEWDVTFQPSLDLELDFGKAFALGYTGGIEIYTQHTDLFYHGHEAYFIANPTFGDGDENEVIIMPYAGTGRNTDTFKSVNLFYAGISLGLDLTPSDLVFWSNSVRSEYRLFYENTPNSSLDTWVRSRLTLSFSTHTSISPRIAYGYRYYPDPAMLAETPWDMQLAPGIRLAQGIGEYSGIWLDYEYLYTFNDNNLVVGEMLNAEMNFTGTDFMFSGHVLSAGGRRIFGEHWEGSLEALYLKRIYSGLQVLDDLGMPTGEGREDDRIGGQGMIKYELEAGAEGQILFSTSLHYQYLRQISNDAWFDTDLHVVSLVMSIDL